MFSAVLAAPEWRARERAHRERADALTAGHRERKRRGEAHPVEDFLWTYYSVRPDASGGTVDYVERLLAATLQHTPRYGCFGLHEWAMVYRMSPEQLRHSALPLRIGHAETDRVVESHPIGCSHFDAYRFFTEEAAPLNALRPTRETQPALEQSACLHAGMDVYKWAAKLGPIVPGEILLDAFVLARDIREVDMRASPYDVSGILGASGAPLTPIPIEIPEGKREYVRLQRGFAARGNALRERVLTAIAAARAAAPA
ncbi:3-methyladenine DNA glycosylase [Leucobacter massiliensis]|uniref:3-methyladenine DNA glycosylase n=1 Tax=Leucobacter massiliensis TaxID=1686285 RepID=A0A2S9QS86_9MICO|nr:3-methyladenine DNA glycosylase [Leucobacter massiliensis]PRI12454.1 3-methyladenine DNA glycosylase [Leucobacter massiliensis]